MRDIRSLARPGGDRAWAGHGKKPPGIWWQLRDRIASEQQIIQALAVFRAQWFRDADEIGISCMDFVNARLGLPQDGQ